MIERLIKFPLPETGLFSSPQTAGPATCICYQYEVNEHGYGPYGFDTKKAKKILTSTFGNFYFWDAKTSTLIETDNIRENGLYFCLGEPVIEATIKELLAYKLKETKRRLLKSSTARDATSIPCPEILNAVTPQNINSEYIAKLLQAKTLFFIQHFFTPASGETLIIFNKDISDAIENKSLEENIPVHHARSIDDLPYW